MTAFWRGGSREIGGIGRQSRSSSRVGKGAVLRLASVGTAHGKKPKRDGGPVASANGVPRWRTTLEGHAPGCRRGRNRPGTWSQPCRDRGRCPAGRRRCPRPCPSSGTSAPSCRCPYRAGRGWRRAGGARRGRRRQPVWERGCARFGQRSLEISDRACGRRSKGGIARRDSRQAIPEKNFRDESSRTASAIARAKPGRARTLATEAVTVVMVIADILS